jgi:hypothetical protein
MPFLHYGSRVCVELDESAAKLAMKAIGAHATRGGWVTVTDVRGRDCALLVSPGVPMWINAVGERRGNAAHRRSLEQSRAVSAGAGIGPT